MRSLSEYGFSTAEDAHTMGYLVDPVLEILRTRPERRILEIGCGNGAMARRLSQEGYSVVGIDPSESGIRIARAAGGGQFEVASVYDDLGRFGRFPIVLSLEVVEHVFYPRIYAKTVFDAVQDSGIALISTPFHGYWKNLALALTGKMDSHFTALWDGGHIKFWSERTLATLLREAGFTAVDFVRTGRIRALAKSMIAIARR